MTSPAIVPTSTPTLDQRAENIRTLLLNWSNNTVELAMEVQAAHDDFPRRSGTSWAKWLKAEVGISVHHAHNLLSIAKTFSGLRDSKKPIPSARVLGFLARPTTPKQAVLEVLERVEQGETIGRTQAKEIARKHAPPPREARKLAAETGKPVLASDNYVYFGTSKESAQAAQDRRTLVYAVRRAVTTLATVEMTPHQFLNYARPHQLWDEEEQTEIGRAAKWLNALHAALEK